MKYLISLRIRFNVHSHSFALSGYCLKVSAPSICSSLTSIFNLSISSNSFPDSWKIAKVSPLFKEGSLFDRSNYRPISVLPIISKILERHVHTSFYSFISDHHLSDSQFGFCKSRSCELVLLTLSIVFSRILISACLMGFCSLILKKLSI